MSSNSSSLSTKAGELIKAENAPIIIVIVVTTLLFIFLIIYITYNLKASNLKGKKLTEEPHKLMKLDPALKIESGDLPVPTVGREYSYSFWIYLESFSKENINITNNAGVITATRPKSKIIMFRGSDGKVETGNFIVMMDGWSNTMYIVIKTQNSSLPSTVKTILDDIIATNYFTSTNNNADNKHLITAIDYVPLTRWVHVAVVIDNKLITVYLDGDIYSVKSIDEYKAIKGPQKDRLGRTIEETLIIEKSDGDLFIGKTKDVDTVDGYIGKVEAFNYAITSNDVKKSYNSGPLDKSLLSFLGINNYSVRNPIYRTDTVETA